MRLEWLVFGTKEPTKQTLICDGLFTTFIHLCNGIIGKSVWDVFIYISLSWSIIIKPSRTPPIASVCRLCGVAWKGRTGHAHCIRNGGSCLQKISPGTHWSGEIGARCCAESRFKLPSYARSAYVVSHFESRATEAGRNPV